MTRKLITAAFIVYVVVCAAGVLVLAQVRGNGAFGPDQPIDFHHPIHVTTVGLECTHCHQTADGSRHAGIPAVETCMECHESAATDRPEVQKLIAYWEEGEPIEWTAVHALPWHVHFTHKRHIQAGVECATCHGPVEAQPRVRQVRSLKMGWCVGCHRERGADTDCMVCHR